MVNGIRWEVVEDASKWDEWLSAFKDRHVRQCSAWAVHKAGGWKAVRTALFNGPTPMAMGLVLERKAPLGAATVYWLNGGPVYQKERPRHLDLAAFEGYLDGLLAFAAGRKAVVRLCGGAPMDLEAQLLLRQKGFARPAAPLDTGLTYVVDLAKPLEELKAGLERRWRGQLKKALDRAPKLEAGRDKALLERYLALHNHLCDRKGLKGLALHLRDLEAMRDELGSRVEFFVVTCDGRDGAGGAVWTFEGKAWFALSAANDWGLKNDLPNAFYWLLIERLKAAGLSSFDLTGIDPKDNWGVYNFKRGLGLPPVEALGEWEWASSPLLGRAFNAALWLRRGRLG